MKGLGQSREGVATSLRKIIFKLWEHEITLQTLNPEVSYEPGCDNSSKFMGLWLFLSQAYEEPKYKSDVGIDARKKKREDIRNGNTKFTTIRPAWLDIVDTDGNSISNGAANKNLSEVQFKPIPEAFETLRLIFKSKMKGVPTNTILEKLNKEWPWKRPNGFGKSYLSKILHNRALIGEYQPHILVDRKRRPEGDVVEDYFPKIIDPEVFHAVQQKMKSNRRSGGRTGKFRNVFRHLVKCAYCGGSMRYDDKGQGFVYYVCDNAANRKGCERHSIRYEEVEKLVLENCTRIKPEQVLPDPDEQVKQCGLLEELIQGINAEIEDNNAKIANLTNQIASTKIPKARNRYEAHSQKIEDENDKLKTRLQDTQQLLAEAEQGQKAFSKWQRDLRTLIKEIKGNPELRQQLIGHLKQFILRIDIFPVGDPQSEEHAGYIDAIVDEVNLPKSDNKLLYQFISEIEERSRTKEGRFVRVIFKTKAANRKNRLHEKSLVGYNHQVDLVPPGSIAFGMELIQKDKRRKAGWRFVSPDIGQFWEEYSKCVKLDTT